MTSTPHVATQRFDGKVAVVTGGASGIGLATTRRLVAEGGRVVVADLDEQRLDEVATELGDAVATVRCDVAAEHDVRSLVGMAEERFGGIDLAFANAGIGSVSLLSDLDVVEWQRVLDVNLTGPFLLIKHAGPRVRPGGSIIVTASLNAVQPAATMSAYCASKAGVAMLVQVAAMELGPKGVRVNAIAPGLVRTPLTEPITGFPTLVDEFVDNTVLGRYAEPDEIAGVVAFLASHEAAYITGTLQLVDGGARTGRYPDLLRAFRG